MSVSEDLDRVTRYARDARTRCHVAAHRLASFHRDNARARSLIGYEAGRLLEGLLDAAELLVPLLRDEDDLADRRKQTADLAARLRKQALIPKLADTTGRTPEEAAAFNRKASSLAK